MTKETSKPIGQWFEEGVRCFKKPDGLGAVRAFRKVIDLDPRYRHTDGDNPYFYLGKIHEVEGDIDNAVVMYSRALAVDQWDEESLIGRGACFTVLNRPDDAVVDFKKVLAIPSQHRRAPVAHLFYAIAENRRKQGAWEKALRWGKKALAEEPHNPRLVELVDEAKRQIGIN